MPLEFIMVFFILKKFIRSIKGTTTESTEETHLETAFRYRLEKIVELSTPPEYDTSYEIRSVAFYLLSIVNKKGDDKGLQEIARDIKKIPRFKRTLTQLMGDEPFREILMHNAGWVIKAQVEHAQQLDSVLLTTSPAISVEDICRVYG